MSPAGRGSVAEAASKVVHSLLPVCLMGAAAFLLAGCASSKSKIDVGAITFTDENGKPVSNKIYNMNAGATLYADVQLTNDTQLLGVDWTVDCESAPPPGTPLPPGVTQDASCGIFLPVHTATAPVPSYASSGAGVVTLFTAPAAPPKSGVVTLFAAATADHSRYSYVTLSIQGLPISIQFGSVPPSAMPVNAAATFKAVLTNDYSAGGASWTVTCGASDCGSFSAEDTASGASTTYTAPSSVPPNGTVVITATSVTDPTKSVSASVTIEPATGSAAVKTSPAWTPDQMTSGIALTMLTAEASLHTSVVPGNVVPGNQEHLHGMALMRNTGEEQANMYNAISGACISNSVSRCSDGQGESRK